MKLLRICWLKIEIAHGVFPLKIFPLKFEVGVVRGKIGKDGEVEKIVAVLRIQTMTMTMKTIGGIENAGTKKMMKLIETLEKMIEG